MTTSRLGIWAGGEHCHQRRRGDDQDQVSTRLPIPEGSEFFDRGMQLRWNSKVWRLCRSWPTSSLGHRAWRKAKLDSAGCPAEIRPAALRVNARVYDLGADAPRPAEYQRGRLGERGGAGRRRTAVDPGERGVLTDRTTAECGGVSPDITYVERTYGMDGLIARLQDCLLLRVNPI